MLTSFDLYYNKTHKMKKILATIILAAIIIACGGPADKTSSASAKKETKKEASDKGIGEIKHVTLNDPLDADMIKRGKAIYEMKCAACHKTTAQRVVGPGFAGVTDRRKPEWIMNMITNVEVMLAEDPEARELLKQCLVRMPNQNLSIGDARDVLEWIYDNDAQNKG